jgi:hypothetical protein
MHELDVCLRHSASPTAQFLTFPFMLIISPRPLSSHATLVSWPCEKSLCQFVFA